MRLTEECWHFQEGECRRGRMCRFAHTPERRARAMPREAIQRELHARRRDSLAMRREYVIIDFPVLRSDERQDSRAPKRARSPQQG